VARDDHYQAPRKGGSPILTGLLATLMLGGTIYGLSLISIIWAAITGVTVAAIGAIMLTFLNLYKKAGANQSIIRTGAGGPKVALSGGIIVVPFMHEYQHVNMNSIKLDVHRRDKQSLLTHDKIRVNVMASFFIRIARNIEAIQAAAQSFGEGINNLQSIQSLLQEKLDGAMRTAAAKSSLDDLQLKREDFAAQILTAVGDDLKKNGMEIETVTITELTQTDLQFFSQDNVFDVEGMANIARRTAEKNLERTKVTNENAVAIANSNKEAKEKTLGVELEVVGMEQKQSQEIAGKKAATAAAIAEKDEEARKARENFRIAADQAIAVSEAQAREAKESATAKAEGGIKAAKAEADKVAGEADVKKSAGIKQAGIETNVQIAEASKRESVAQAEASNARAEAVKAEQAVITVQQEAEATRVGNVATIKAKAEAEVTNAPIAVKAERELEAAKHSAAATRIRTEAEANRIETTAKADATAVTTRARAEADGKKAEAEGITAIGAATASAIEAEAEARGKMSDKQINLILDTKRVEVSGKLVDQLPEILGAMLAPMASADLRIVHMNGGTGSISDMAGTTAVASGSREGDVVGSALAAVRAHGLHGPLIATIASALAGEGNVAEKLVGQITGGIHIGSPAAKPAIEHHEETPVPPAATPAGNNGAGRAPPRAASRQASA